MYYSQECPHCHYIYGPHHFESCYCPSCGKDILVRPIEDLEEIFPWLKDKPWVEEWLDED